MTGLEIFLARIHELERQLLAAQQENQRLRDQILSEGQTIHDDMAQRGEWGGINGTIRYSTFGPIEPVEIAELARPIGSTDKPTTHDGVRLDKAIKPRSRP